MKNRTRMLTSIDHFKAGIAFVLLYLLAPISQANTLYTLADLEVLRDGKNYQEFFQHAKDVVPTKRDKHWHDMLSNMTSDFVDELRRKKIFNQKSFLKVEELSKWPEQKRDEFFQVKHQAYAVEYFKMCLSGLTGDTPPPAKSSCQNQMKTFWKNSKKDVETAYRLLLLQVGFFPQNENWVYLSPMVTSELSNIYCQKPIVVDAFLDHLHHLDLSPVTQQDSDKALEFKLKSMANDDCWKAIVPGLKAALIELPTQESTNLFFIAKSLGQMDEVMEATWLTRYFLENPAPGKIFNMAWSKLSQISQTYDLRMKVLKNLLTLDPLPGSIFSLRDNEKRRILSVQFFDNFPEYLQKYAQTCMNYLTGEQTFPRGNPTKECHDLIKLDRSLRQKNLVSDEVHLKYSAIEKRMGK